MENIVIPRIFLRFRRAGGMIRKGAPKVTGSCGSMWQSPTVRHGGTAAMPEKHHILFGKVTVNKPGN
jgi:hypothetical protein